MANLGSTKRGGVPRWVKIGGAVALALLILVMGLVALGHNPLQHMSHGMAGG